MIKQATTPITEDTWKVCRPFLQSALDKGGNKDWELGDVKDFVNSGSGALLYASDQEGIIYASAVIAMTNYHQRKVLELYLFGADADSGWELLFPVMMDFAKGEGCSNIRVNGRRWVKVLSRFAPCHEIYSTEVDIM